MNALKRFLLPDQKPTQGDYEQATLFLKTLLEKPQFSGLVKVDELNPQFVNIALESIIQELGKDSKFNLGLLTKYQKDKNFPDTDFVKLFEFSKNHFDSQESRVSFIATQIVERLILDNFETDIAMSFIPTIAKEHRDSFANEDIEIKREYLAKQLKYLLRRGDYKVISETLFTVVKYILAHQPTQF